MNDQHEWRNKEDWVWIPSHERHVKRNGETVTFKVTGHWRRRR